MIVLIPYIKLLNLSWIKNMSIFFRNMESLKQANNSVKIAWGMKTDSALLSEVVLSLASSD